MTDAIMMVIEPKEVNDEAVNTVNARELHEKLGSKQEFAHWIKARIEQCVLTEGIDFIRIDNFITSPPSKDYHLTLEAAKHLAMLERNDQGRLVRQYFIDFEKTTRERLPQKTFAELTLEVLTGLQDQVKMLETQNASQGILLEQQAPKVAAYDHFLDSSKGISIDAVAKALFETDGIKIGRNRLWQKLREWEAVVDTFAEFKKVSHNPFCNEPFGMLRA